MMTARYRWGDGFKQTRPISVAAGNEHSWSEFKRGCSGLGRTPPGFLQPSPKKPGTDWLRPLERPQSRTPCLLRAQTRFATVLLQGSPLRYLFRGSLADMKGEPGFSCRFK